MEWLWVAQITVNFLFLVGMIFWWTDRGSRRARVLEDRMQQMLGDMRKKSEKIEAQSTELKRRMDESFGLMVAIGNQARELLERSREEVGRRIPTLEEQDLLGLHAPSVPPGQGSATSHFSSDEQTSEQTITEPPLALRSVLREQLL